MRRDGRNHKRWMLLMVLGLLLIAAALFLGAYNLWDDSRAGMASRQIVEKLPKPSESETLSLDPDEQVIPDYQLNPDMEMPEMEIEGNDYIGTLEIPDLDLSLPVMGDWSYPKLKIAPCRYSGSAYQGGLVIAAHNYSRHFGRLNQLQPGAQVKFTDIDGNVFEYKVAEIQNLEPAAIEEMTDSGWDLSLFTCTLGGQSRITVRCQKTEKSGML